MLIKVNQKELEVPDYFAIKNLLKHLKYNNSVAIWVNGRQILISQYN